MGNPLTIGSIYIPPGQEDKLIELDKVLEKLTDKENILLTGNFNCRHLLWERWHEHVPGRDSIAWAMGNDLLHILNKHGYTVLNNSQYTRSMDSKFSSPDITAVKGSKHTFTWNVDHTAHLSSDHHPILVSIGKITTDKKTMRDLKRTDWENWRHTLSSSIDNFSTDTENKDANTKAHNLTYKVTEVA